MKQPIKLLNYHAHRWDEPLLMDQSNPGQRGLLVPQSEQGIKEAVGTADRLIPENMLRKNPPDLPELAQPQVLRHFFRLSQMTSGTDVANDIGGGTCTMKYSPKINEQLAASPKMTEIHPDQEETTIQGILEILYKMGEVVKEITGMDEVSFQPGSGSQALLSNSAIVRAYHEDHGNHATKNEIVTTMFSHPSDAATPSTLGYEVNIIIQTSRNTTGSFMMSVVYVFAIRQMPTEFSVKPGHAKRDSILFILTCIRPFPRRMAAWGRHVVCSL